MTIPMPTTQRSEAMRAYGLPTHYRLKHRADFQRVFAGRQSATDALLRVCGGTNDCAHPRLGLSVSRRLGNAVRRNRYKRLLREAFRLVREQLPALDIVVIPQPGSEPDLEAYLASLVALAQRLERRLRRTPQ